MSRLRRLVKRKQRAEIAHQHALDVLALAVLDATEREGASRREIGRAIDQPFTSVQGWVERGQDLRRPLQ